MRFRSSHPEVFLGKDVLKIYSKFTGEHPCQNVISINLLCNFIEITLQHRCSPVNLLHIFRTPFLKNTSKWLLLAIVLSFLLLISSSFYFFLCFLYQLFKTNFFEKISLFYLAVKKSKHLHNSSPVNP